MSSDDPLLRYQPPGLEWTPPGQTPSSCLVCGTPFADAYVEGAAQFCESCGAERPGPAPLPEGVAAALDPDVALLPARPCVQCGGDVDSDGYCTTCGAKAQSERDHYREEPAAWVAGVCDRGVRHQRNEDAMALGASPETGARAVLVVCDGVSSSIDSDVASLAGAEAARDLLWANQPRGIGTQESHLAAMTAALQEAATAANDAVVDTTDPESPNAASATFAAAVVQDGHVFVANLGDSRVYWVPDSGHGAQLTVDDSVAQARIEAGVSREEAETGEGSHAITKWLGRDAPDLEARVADLAPKADGWVLACSDGLWNYASTPADINRVLRSALDAEPAPTGLVEVCERMVAWANEQGGKDNITVALARIGSPITYRVAEETAEAHSTPPPQSPSSTPPVAAAEQPVPAPAADPPPETRAADPGVSAAEPPAPAPPVVRPVPPASPEPRLDPVPSGAPAPATPVPPATGQEHPLDGSPTRRSPQGDASLPEVPPRPPQGDLAPYPPQGSEPPAAPAAQPVWAQPRQEPDPAGTGPAGGPPLPHPADSPVRAAGDEQTLQPYPPAPPSRAAQEGQQLQPHPPIAATAAPGGDGPPTAAPPPAPSAATGADETSLTPFPSAGRDAGTQ